MSECVCGRERKRWCVSLCESVCLNGVFAFKHLNICACIKICFCLCVCMHMCTSLCLFALVPLICPESRDRGHSCSPQPSPPTVLSSQRETPISVLFPDIKNTLSNKVALGHVQPPCFSAINWVQIGYIRGWCLILSNMVLIQEVILASCRFKKERFTCFQSN